MSVARSNQGSGIVSPGLSREVAFDVLSSQRRRYVLHRLLGDECQGESELRELTTQIAAWENDTDPDSVTSKQRMRVYTALRQSHLPKMDREGVVEFDPVSGGVELTEEARELEVYLDVVPHNEIPWSDYYLGVGAIGLVIVGALWMDVVPFTAMSDLAWAAILTAVFTASAATHTYRNRQNKLGAKGQPPT